MNQFTRSIAKRKRPAETRAVIEALESRTLLSAVWTGVGADGDKIKITLVGEGSMSVVQPTLAPGNPDILTITLTDTEGCDTFLNFTVTKMPGGDGFVNVGRITGNNNAGIHQLNGAQVNLVGTATVVPLNPAGDGTRYGLDLQGYLKTALLHNISSNIDVWAKQPGVWYPNCAPTQLTVNDIGADSNITLGSMLEKFTAHSWAAGGVLDVKSIKAMTVSGDFEAGINVLRKIGTVTVLGDVGGAAGNAATWNTPRTIGAIRIGSSNANWIVSAGGAVAGVTATAGNMNYNTWSSLSLGGVTAAKGDMIGSTLTLTQPVDAANPKLQALGRVTVGKSIGGNWNIEGHVGAISAGSTLAGFTADIVGDVASLTTTTGNFNFSNWASNSLGSMTVKQQMLSGVMQLSQAVAPGKFALGRAYVGNYMTDTTIRAVGNIGTVNALAMDAVNIFAGVKPAVNGVVGTNTPQPAADYLTGPDASIAGITVRGLPGTPGQPWTRHSIFGGNIIAARTGPMSLFGPLDGGGPSVTAKSVGAISITKPDGTRYSGKMIGGEFVWNDADAASLVTVVVLT